jgi:hypothetical protein
MNEPKKMKAFSVQRRMDTPAQLDDKETHFALAAILQIVAST